MTVASQVNQTISPDIYSNADARKILEFLLETPHTVIAATILPSDELRYEQLEKILGRVPDDAGQLLGDMASAGTLVPQLVDKVPACPDCGSKQVSTRYSCPKCSTYDINRTYLFEHLKCGKVGNEGSFRKGDQIICPKCQAILHDFGVEYRAIGVWYECNKCQNSFNNPNHSHFCRPKHHQFSTDRVNLVPAYQYELNRAAMEKIRREVLVYAEAITYLENLGLTVKAPYSLTGKSGQAHRFDIVITLPKKGWRSEERTVAVDVIVKGFATETEVFKNFVAKVRDTRPSDPYLIATPGVTEDARQILSGAKLNVFEGPTLKEAMQDFQSKSVIKDYVG